MPAPGHLGMTGRRPRGQGRRGAHYVWRESSGGARWRAGGGAACQASGRHCVCIRESLRHHSLRGLEARRLRTFGGLGGELDREACRQGLAVARTKLEASLLRGLVGGAT